jgi:hypothetical protein
MTDDERELLLAVAEAVVMLGAIVHVTEDTPPSVQKQAGEAFDRLHELLAEHIDAEGNLIRATEESEC